MNEILENYRKDLEHELSQILGFWQQNTIDKTNGGFYGKIDNDNKIFQEAPKGSLIYKEFGGVYRTVDYKGKPLDTKKQIYALAFAISGLSEFYISSKNEE